ncbi:hypothetical protein KP509_03G011500 [Ceratopteris richardii]|nr:hypothetical protein KP509_03G011500 [Ceratopteris richardii]
MYARCGALEKARELLDVYGSGDVFTWTAIIVGYTDKGQPEEALCIFAKLQQVGLIPNAVTLVYALKACGSIRAIKRGEEIHELITKDGFLTNNVKLCTALLGMYVKCGSLLKARQVLEELPVRDVISWNALITGYVEHDKGQEALLCFDEMQREGLLPDSVTIACILRACGSMKEHDKGERIYNQFVKEGVVEQDIVLGNALIDMYAKCGALEKAQQVLQELPVRNFISWNIMIAGCTNHGKNKQALKHFDRMIQEGISPDAVTYTCALKACGCIGATDVGQKLHDEIAKQGLLQNHVKLGTALVDMYAKSGAFTKAWQVLEALPVRNVVSWNALIAGYVEDSKGEQALDCLEQMQYEGLSPDVVTFTCILKACGNIGALDEGERIHHEIAQQGLLATHDILGNALLAMYANCGALAKAWALLQELPMRSVISWNIMIGAYANESDGEQALICFEQMQQENHVPDAVTYASLLKVYGSTGVLDKGERIHNVIAQRKLLEKHTELGSALIDMYAKCGAFRKAWDVLDGLYLRNVVCWNALITGYVEHGQGEKALDCVEQMQGEGFSPDAITCLCIFKACGIIRHALKGEKIHDEIAEKGWLQDNAVLITSLVDMYAKCGSFTKARSVLEGCRIHNVMSWNALLAGYAEHGEGYEAIRCYEEMQCNDISPDAATFSCILKACSSIRAYYIGEEIHKRILDQNMLRDNVILGTALVDIYAKCGALAKAHRVLEELPVRNVISWNALITGYIEHDKCAQAFWCFSQIKHEGLSPNSVTYTCILQACGSLQAADKGEEIHNEIELNGMLGTDIVLDTALVDMYAKCGALEKAHGILEKLPLKNVVSWNALIAGYCQHEADDQALLSFEQMKRNGVHPDSVTFTCVLKACGSIGAADQGEKIHGEIVKQGLSNNNIVLCTALLGMYSKCGAAAKAQQLLKDSSVRDVISWNALIVGLIQQGEVVKALKCFEQMQTEGFSPDVATFSSVLSACSRIGLVDEAQSYFMNMSAKYGVTPDLEHYACMIDLFGRAGHLDRAVEVIEKLPSPNSGVWSTLLGACRKWEDIIVGRWAFEHALKVDKSDSAAYVLMANIYASAGMEEDAKTIEIMSIENKATMKQAHSWWIDKTGYAHQFHTGETNLVKIDQIHLKLKDLAQKVNAFSKFKIHSFCVYCDKMALAFALINTPVGESVSVMFDKPICCECHIGTSLISEIEHRIIIVHDQNRRHVFQDGKCSCEDSWVE